MSLVRQAGLFVFAGLSVVCVSACLGLLLIAMMAVTDLCYEFGKLLVEFMK